ncbi:MAG TPA: hypothetical protein VM493_07675 [Vicinamibacterales bacterium]|nr:hypothetical protein [Vicinamibacterales bacterium]
MDSRGRKVSLQLEFSNGAKVALEAEFTPAESEALSRFALETDRLLQARVLREQSEGVGVTRRYDSYDEEKGITAERRNELLHRLRPFLLQRQPTYFYRVCEILDRRLQHESVHVYLEHQRAVFSGEAYRALLRGPAERPAGTVVIDSEEISMKWLHGSEYHRDPDKFRSIEGQYRVPLQGSAALIIMEMMDMAKAISNVTADLVRPLKLSTVQ